MSWEATGWAVKQRIGSSSGKLVLLAISQYADQVGAVYWSQRKLMEETELGEETLRQRLNELEELGLIARFKQERDNGGFTVDMIVVLHDETAHDYARWLLENSQPQERGGHVFPTVSFTMAKSYERPERSRGYPRKSGDGGIPPKQGKPSQENRGTHTRTVGEPLKHSLKPSSKSYAPHRERDPCGEAEGSAGKEARVDGEALRGACLAAERGDGNRVFVDYGSDAFKAWTRTYREIGLHGPSWSKRLAPDAASSSGYSIRNGSWFPSELPPNGSPPVAQVAAA